MPAPKLFSDTMFAYERSLDFRSMRHNLLTTNVANAETPNFKAKDVKFEKFFQDALSRWRLSPTIPFQVAAPPPPPETDLPFLPSDGSHSPK